MTSGPEKPARGLAHAALALALALSFYFALGRVGFKHPDEGFLWYGVERVLEGQVPLRDFQAYEPGRYYWCALFTLILGPGVLSVRFAAHAFQVLGLVAAISVLRRFVPRGFLIPLAILIACWMFPRHKLFESSLALLAVAFGCRLIERPSRRAFFASGCFAGIAAFFGRNHGLYATTGLVALTVLLIQKRALPHPLQSLGSALLGLLCGLTPLLAMLLLAPGFGQSLVDSTRFIMQQGANLPYPPPWPWNGGRYLRGEGGHLSFATLSATFGIALSYLPAGILFSLRGNSRQPFWPVIASTAVFGALYAHHAAIRSDVDHIAQAIHPALLGMLALPGAIGLRATAQRACLLGLLVLTGSCAILYHPELEQLARGRSSGKLVSCEIRGQPLFMPEAQAEYYRGIEGKVTRMIGEGQIFIAPSMPLLYPVLGKRAPVWRIYFLWQADRETQLSLIDALNERGVDWALIGHHAIDGRPEMRFTETHPLVWEFLQREFETVSAPSLSAQRQELMRRRR